MRLFKRPFGVGAAPGLWLLSPGTILRALRSAVQEPTYFVARVRLAAWQVAHPGWPWLTPAANGFLARYLRPDMHVLEFGSGRSTLWLARRCASITSVEDDPQWHGTVLGRAQGLPVDLRLVAAGPDHAARYAGVASEFPDASLDLILVDGAHRNACIALAAAKVKPGGVMIVDNADMRGLDTSPLAVSFEHRPTTDGVVRTDIYRRAGPTC